ncbi:hypothetical protein U724_10030 [Pseudomonas chlororaphis subsp. aurantiaca PB-St2]|nr:hypothetical protein U724_10030 [Pseudomonas chlororaphis subsp. aurantiaca PB-St2]
MVQTTKPTSSCRINPTVLPPGVEQLNVMHATHAMKAPKRGDYKEMVSI